MPGQPYAAIVPTTILWPLYKTIFVDQACEFWLNERLSPDANGHPKEDGQADDLAFRAEIAPLPDVPPPVVYLFQSQYFHL